MGSGKQRIICFEALGNGIARMSGPRVSATGLPNLSVTTAIRARLSVTFSPDQQRPMLLATIYSWRGERAGLPLVCIAEGGYLVAVHVPSRIEAAGVVPRRRSDKLGSVAMQDLIIVREWDADSFHKRVLELESQGFKARRDTYRISPEMDPESGTIVHLHTIEMSRPKA